MQPHIKMEVPLLLFELSHSQHARRDGQSISNCHFSFCLGGQKAQLSLSSISGLALINMCLGRNQTDLWWRKLQQEAEDDPVSLPSHHLHTRTHPPLHLPVYTMKYSTLEIHYSYYSTDNDVILWETSTCVNLCTTYSLHICTLCLTQQLVDMHIKFCACAKLLAGICIQQLQPSAGNLFKLVHVCLFSTHRCCVSLCDASLHNGWAGKQQQTETQTRSCCRKQAQRLLVVQSRRCEVWEDVLDPLARWACHVSSEGWREAHTLQAEKWQKLGTSQSSNQAHPMFTKCSYLQKPLLAQKTWRSLNFMKRLYLSGRQNEAEERVFPVGWRHKLVYEGA